MAMNDGEFAQAAASALARSAEIETRRIKRPVGEGSWYIARVISKSDEQAIEWLDRMGIGSWYPKIMEMRNVPRKLLSAAQRRSGIEIRKPILSPLFPRYVFVDLRSGEHWGEISRFAGIGGMWCEGGVPVRINEADLKKIKGREQNGAIPGAESLRVIFGIGDEVTVTDGPFASFPGIVEKGLDTAVEEFDPETRIRVAVNIFGRATPVDLEVWQVAKR
jgi:transcriptional antiterminator NusG